MRVILMVEGTANIKSIVFSHKLESLIDVIVYLRLFLHAFALPLHEHFHFFQQEARDVDVPQQGTLNVPHRTLVVLKLQPTPYHLIYNALLTTHYLLLYANTTYPYSNLLSALAISPFIFS